MKNATKLFNTTSLLLHHYHYNVFAFKVLHHVPVTLWAYTLVLLLCPHCHVFQLEISSLERSRSVMAEELVRLTNENDEMDDKVKDIPKLKVLLKVRAVVQLLSWRHVLFSTLLQRKLFLIGCYKYIWFEMHCHAILPSCCRLAPTVHCLQMYCNACD